MTTTPAIVNTFKVRKSVNRSGLDRFAVVRNGQRASSESYPRSDMAQAHADRLNVNAMVTPAADDPRPYSTRWAEAAAAYEAATGRPVD